MSLQVWLPLNGDLHNYGLSDITITGNAGAIYYNDGKIGKAINLNKRINITCNQLAGLTSFSVAFWAKTMSSETLTTNWQDLLGFTDVSTNGTTGQFRFETCYNNIYKGVHWHDNATNAIVNGAWTPSQQEQNVWHHYCVVIKENEYIKSYLDGVLNQTHTANLYGGHLRGDFWIGETNNIEGALNDVRIYDHCLSAKEVEEISKGLILHYKLDTIGSRSGNPNLGNTSANYLNQQFKNPYQASSWGGDVGTVTYYQNGGYNNLPYKVYHKTATGSGGIYKKTDNDIIIEAGKTYTFSCWIKSSRNYTESAYGFNINRGSDNYYINYGASLVLTTDWKLFSKTFTATTDQAGTYGEMSIIYDDNVTDYYVYYSGFKIEEGTEATAWVDPRENNQSIIYDSSGYGNNGTIVGSLETTTSSPRYSCATKLNKSKINSMKGFPSGPNPDFTIIFWVKLFSDVVYTSYTDLIYFTDNDDIGQGGFRLELCGSPPGNNLMWFRGLSGQNGGGFNMNSNSSSNWFSKDTWHQIGLSGKGNTKQYICYFDGEQCGNYNGSANSWTPSGAFYLGDTQSTIADFSDLRMYTTALTAEQIKELYNTSMTIDNQGNIHARELVEI